MSVDMGFFGPDQATIFVLMHARLTSCSFDLDSESEW